MGAGTPRSWSGCAHPHAWLMSHLATLIDGPIVLSLSNLPAPVCILLPHLRWSWSSLLCPIQFDFKFYLHHDHIKSLGEAYCLSMKNITANRISRSVGWLDVQAGGWQPLVSLCDAMASGAAGRQSTASGARIDCLAGTAACVAGSAEGE